MKKILVLGAGHSTPYLIRRLLDEAQANDWFVTVGDRDVALARRRVGQHPRGHAIRFDVGDTTLRQRQIQAHDLVVNMLPPAFQFIVADDCVTHGRSMVSASYEDIRMRDLDADAHRRGVLILSECGLDPGIDHMSAVDMVRRVRAEGAEITALRSYGGSVPAPEFDGNPLRYAITWNPRNVLMAGETGATYLVDGKTKMVPWHEVFQRTWPVDVDGIGPMEAYPNRDSTYYREQFGLENVETMIRGTLRYPGWCETWQQVVRLGIPNETMRFPSMPAMTYRSITEMFLPVHTGDGELETRIAQYLGISPTGRIMENLRWLGLFDDVPVPRGAHTVADAMIALLARRLRLGPGDRDMVVLMHELEARWPGDGRRERVRTTLVEYGEPGGITAIARTVGLPLALAAALILRDELPLTGCHIPVHPAICGRILTELRRAGLRFEERRERLPDQDDGGGSTRESG